MSPLQVGEAAHGYAALSIAGRWLDLEIVEGHGIVAKPLQFAKGLDGERTIRAKTQFAR